MSRIRSTALRVLLASLAFAGCRQHCFMTEADYNHYRQMGLTACQNCPSPEEITPALDVGNVTTVLAPEATERSIGLAECIALALENGRTGEFFDRGGRRTSVSGLQRQALAGNLTDSVRVFAYEPALASLEIEQSLAKFDAQWRSSMTWNKVDRPVGTALETFQAGDQINVISQDTAEFRSGLVKPLPTGGLAGITFRTEYDFSNLRQRVNPAYRPALEFSIEQPLLQGSGVGINQLRTTHPGSIREQVSVGGRVPGILLTRIFADEAQAEFERRIHELLFTVEEAYWELYAAYYDLYSRETALRQAHFAWGIAKSRFDTGRIPIQDFMQIQQQLQTFRGQRLDAMGRGTARLGVLEAERRLRYLVGLPAEDGTRLMPTDAPTVASVRPDWRLAVSEAIGRRPELIQVRQEIRVAQLAIIREKDALLPDLRFFSTYNVNALGKHLDGKDQDSALRNLAENEFNDWTIGLRLDMPLGYREAHAEVHRARLQLAQRVHFLRDQEEKTILSLQRSYRELIQFQEQIGIQRGRREAATLELEARYQDYEAGRATTTIDVLLESQRNWADAIRDEHFAIADYNVALIDFERQRGTIMQYNNVAIVDGPLPAYAQSRASAHIRERQRAIVLKEGPLCHRRPGGEHCTPAKAPALPPSAPAPSPSRDESLLAPKELPESVPGTAPAPLNVEPGVLTPRIPGTPDVEPASAETPAVEPASAVTTEMPDIIIHDAKPLDSSLEPAAESKPASTSQPSDPPHGSGGASNSPAPPAGSQTPAELKEEVVGGASTEPAKADAAPEAAPAQGQETTAVHSAPEPPAVTAPPAPPSSQNEPTDAAANVPAEPKPAPAESAPQTSQAPQAPPPAAPAPPPAGPAQADADDMDDMDDQDDDMDEEGDDEMR